MKHDNSGNLFKNERKDNDDDRDYWGSITVAGTEFWLSGWVRQGPKKKYIRLVVKPKQEKVEREDLQDEVPF